MLNNEVHLGRLVSVQKRYRSRAAVPNIFGDAYLMRHNPLYRNVRTHALAGGYKFQQKDKIAGELPKLLMLKVLHEKKVISYFPTRKMFENSVKGAFKSYPALKFIANFYTDLTNVSLHEGAHAMAHAMTKSLARSARPNGLTARAKLTFMLQALEESFANTVEFTGFCLNKTTEAELLYAINSIIAFVGNEAKEVRTLARMTPPAGFVRAAFLCFVFHHYQFDRLEVDQLNMIKRFSAISSSAFLKRLFKATAFNRQGVAATESTYLKFCGVKAPFLDLLKFDITQELTRNTSVLAAYAVVLDQAIAGIKSL